MRVRLFLFMFSILVVPGCATVAQNNDNALNFGFFTSRSEASKGSRTEEHSIFGLWVSKYELGAGFKKEKKVILDSDCQIIFLIDTAEKFEAAVGLLESTLEFNEGQICTVKKKQN